MSGGPETIRKNYHLAWETFEHLLVLYPTEPRVMLIKDISDFSPWTSFRSIATKQDWKLSNMFAALELNLELKATCVQDQGAETYIPNDGAAKFEYWYGVEEAFEKPKVPLELPVGDLTVSTDPFTSRRRWHSAVHATGCARLDGPELLVYMGTKMAKAVVTLWKGDSSL